MPRLAAVLLAAVVSSLAFAFSAGVAGAAIRECGSTAGVRNITTRGVSCSAARAFARAYVAAPACTEDQRCRLRRFTCRNRVVRGSVDARCALVMRFQHSYL
jgi:hypothetical protein